VILHPAFELAPWQVSERSLDLDVLAQTESVFALSNGHVGLRGNLDEGEPHGLPGTYLAGLYEERPLPYPEGGYGYPEAGQSVVNVTDGKIIRLLVNDEPFDVRYGRLLRHERTLDLRAGLLRRRIEWRSPAGVSVAVRSSRLVSFSQRAVAAIAWEVEPLDAPVRVVVQSELVCNQPLPAGAVGDPRVAAALSAPLASEDNVALDGRVVLTHVTRASGLRIGAGMDHVIDGPEGTKYTTEGHPDLGRVTVASELAAGQRLRLVKYVAYGWSSVRSQPAVRAQVVAALAEAAHTGWDGLLDAQRAYLDEFWTHADVEIQGDAELQEAVRFGLFHVLQAGARTEGRAIAAKGLTGPGYDGHAFWDTESFVLPVLTYTQPRPAGDALRWRHSILDKARGRAQILGLRGAAFPWRTIGGEECSGYWPAGTAAFHVSADIADAVSRYISATQDEAFTTEVGLEILVETARLWRSLGHHDAHGGFRIDGVTGPDEYSAVADNNVYTNLMAARNLRTAADFAERLPDRAAELGVDPEESAAWRDAAAAIVIPYDEALGVHQQAEGFTQHQRWDFERTPPEHYPLLLHYPYFDLYRKQVVKQADLVLALHVCGHHFSREQKVRDFAYYEGITVRDSSLSACTQSVIAAEVGQLELAYDYMGEAALMDLHDLEHNTRDGLHMASLAGAWIAAVAGFGGLRDHGDELAFSPRIPRALVRLAFGMCYRGRRLRVQVRREEATYSLIEGEPLALRHHGDPFTVAVGAPATHRIPALGDVAPRPQQPPGRAPARREHRVRSAASEGEAAAASPSRSARETA
jgi:alpha,alpha-trehalose phosphorylase